ncbi:MAG: DUF2141 domain-containing protein [Myxococcota bacterium]
MLKSLLVLFPLLAANPAGPSVSISVQGLESSEGQVICALYGSRKGFPTELEKAQRVKRVPIKGQKASCLFDRLASGTYAIAVIHDEDKDGELDTNFLGIPSEPVGVSKNVRGSFGPPKFADAAFQMGDSARALKISVE